MIYRGPFIEQTGFRLIQLLAQPLPPRHQLVIISQSSRVSSVELTLGG